MLLREQLAASRAALDIQILSQVISADYSWLLEQQFSAKIYRALLVEVLWRVDQLHNACCIRSVNILQGQVNFLILDLQRRLLCYRAHIDGVCHFELRVLLVPYQVQKVAARKLVAAQFQLLPVDPPRVAFPSVNCAVWRCQVGPCVRRVEACASILLANRLDRAECWILDALQIVIHLENEGRVRRPHFVNRVLGAVEPVLAPEGLGGQMRPTILLGFASVRRISW